MKTRTLSLWAILERLELRFVSSAKLQNQHRPVFVVGPPRSGTTFVYLLLTNSFRVAFLPNFARQHPNACLVASLFSRIRWGYATTFRNEYGHVLGGPGAPSDGWEVFHRWFPRYDLSQPVRTGNLHELRTIVRCLEVIYRGPFVNKNNNHAPRVPYLADLFPTAVFVHVHRDLAATVQSVLRGREANNVPPGSWWSTVPPRLWNLPFADDVERSIATVWDTHEQLREQLEPLGPDRYLRLSYERALELPGGLIQMFRDRYEREGPKLTHRPGWRSSLVRASSGSPRQVDPELRSRVAEVVHRLERLTA